MNTDFAWATGIFEGEGTMGVYPWGNKQELVVAQIMMTDKDVLLRFKEAVNCGNVSGPFNYKNSVKPIYRWRVNRQKEIHEMLTEMMPLLGERRSAKAKEVLAWIESRPRFKKQLSTKE